MRTNIDIDDDLMQKAMAASNSPTKKAAVEAALRLMVQLMGQGEALESLWGATIWSGPEDDWFAPDPLDPNWKPAKVKASTFGESSRTPEVVKEHGRR